MARLRLFLLCLLHLPFTLGAQPDRAAFVEGMRLLQANEPAKAEGQFARAIALNPKVGEYHLRLGQAVGAQAATASTVRQPFLARRVKAAFEEAIALDPSLVEAREGLIFFYSFAPSVMGGSEEKAREQQRALVKLNPMRGQMAAATLAARQRDTSAVERSLRAAMAAAPDSAAPVVQLAQRQAGWGRTAAAFATLEAFLARHPTDLTARIQFGRLAGSSGQQLGRGERYLREVLAGPAWPMTIGVPSRAQVQYRLGVILEKSGRIGDARAANQQALATDLTRSEAVEKSG
ncbi:MAG: tetratricopeptide repeat protein, partial [Gemmatimonadaceae bacterium]